MWTCIHCSTEIEDAKFDVCWNCGFHKETSLEEAELFLTEIERKKNNKIKCLRCEDETMAFAGSRQFHEGARWGILGNLAELMVRKETFDLYICSLCGKAEFYAATYVAPFVAKQLTEGNQ